MYNILGTNVATLFLCIENWNILFFGFLEANLAVQNKVDFK